MDLKTLNNLNINLNQKSDSNYSPDYEEMEYSKRRNEEEYDDENYDDYYKVPEKKVTYNDYRKDDYVEEENNSEYESESYDRQVRNPDFNEDDLFEDEKEETYNKEEKDDALEVGYVEKPVKKPVKKSNKSQTSKPKTVFKSGDILGKGTPFMPFTFKDVKTTAKKVSKGAKKVGKSADKFVRRNLSMPVPPRAPDSYGARRSVNVQIEPREQNFSEMFLGNTEEFSEKKRGKMNFNMFENANPFGMSLDREGMNDNLYSYDNIEYDEDIIGVGNSQDILGFEFAGYNKQNFLDIKMPKQKKQKESFGFGNFSGDVFGLSLKKPNKKSKKIFDWL